MNTDTQTQIHKFKYTYKSYLKHQTSVQPELTGLGPRLTDSSTPDKTDLPIDSNIQGQIQNDLNRPVLPIQIFKGKFRIPEIDQFCLFRYSGANLEYLK